MAASGYDELVTEKESGKRASRDRRGKRSWRYPQAGGTLKFWKSDR